MKKQGQVVRVEGEMAYIAVERQEACGGKCEACGGCAGQENVSIVEVKNDLGVEKGDCVMLEAPEGKLLKYSLLLYTVPLIAFILGLVISIYVFSRMNIESYEIYSFLIGLFCVGLAIIVIKIFDENAFISSSNVIRLERIIK